jgi:hypothetical protein
VLHIHGAKAVISSYSMVEVAATGTARGAALGRIVSDAGWRVLVGTAAGAVAGLVVGGIGGRLARLLLRLTSPETAIGLTSDDGFEIGVVSTSTLNLLVATTGLGGVAGALYAGVRGALPARLRLPLWVVLWACVGGAGLVHDDGVDFTELEPGWLAVALFVALPLLGAAAIVALTERWSRRPPWSGRAFTAGLVVAAAASTLALLVSAAVGAVMVVVLALLAHAGPRVADRARLIAAVGVPVVLVAFAVFGLTDLVPESRRIVD